MSPNGPTTWGHFSDTEKGILTDIKFLVSINTTRVFIDTSEPKVQNQRGKKWGRNRSDYALQKAQN